MPPSSQGANILIDPATVPKYYMVSNISGANQIIAESWINTLATNQMIWGISGMQGGPSLNQFYELYTNKNTMRAFWSFLNPTITLFEDGESYGNVGDFPPFDFTQETNLIDLVNFWKTNNPNMDAIICGHWQDYAMDSIANGNWQTAIDAEVFYRQIAQKTGIAYFDAWTTTLSYFTNIVNRGYALNWAANSTSHPTASFYNFYISCLWSWLD